MCRRLLRVDEIPDREDPVSENADPIIKFGDDDSPVDAETFEVTDQDGAVATVTYSVEGDDREVFSFVSGVLTFMDDHEPDYEEKSSYSITVVARSGGLSTTLDVTIEVVDTEDAGVVSLSQRQPQVGREVSANLSDPDGGVRIDRWMWELSDEITVEDDGTPSAECREDTETTDIDVVDGWIAIDGASSAAYTPKQADVGRCLRATAVYTDNIENPGDTAIHRATGVLERPVQEQQGLPTPLRGSWTRT